MRRTPTKTPLSIIHMTFGLAAFGLAGGLAGGLAFGPAFGLAFGLAFGPAFGLAGGQAGRLAGGQGGVQAVGGLLVGLVGGLVFGEAYITGYVGGFCGGLVLIKGAGLLVRLGWQRAVAEKLTFAVAAAKGLLARSRGKATNQTSSLSLESALEHAAKELARKAQTLPEDQREATLLTAIDKLHEQAQTPDDAARMARDIGRGMLDIALRDYMKQPDSFTRLWDSVTLRLLGAGVAIATALTIATSLSQLLAGDLNLERFVALVVLLAGAGLLGGVAAVGESRRRQP